MGDILWPTYFPDEEARTKITGAVEVAIGELHKAFTYYFTQYADDHHVQSAGIDKYARDEIIKSALMVVSASTSAADMEEARLEKKLFEEAARPYRDRPQYNEQVHSALHEEKFQSRVTNLCTTISDMFLRAKREYMLRQAQSKQPDELRGMNGF